jgi:ADP-heptose:LPS heptosyltransferase
MRNGSKNNPKDYPRWKEVIKGLKEIGYKVTQIGIAGEELLGEDEVMFNLPLKELSKLLKECHTWISVDNFFQHLAYLDKKKGVVIFGQSDPNIFGHKQNINLLKDRKYLREKQFANWEQAEYRADVFVEPQEIINAVKRI